MTRRKDGRWVKKFLINGRQIYFYSSESTEKKAQKDIDKQMLEYTNKAKRGKAFKEVAEEWQNKHFETIEHNTQRFYTAPINDAIDYFGNTPIKNITSNDISMFIQVIASKGYAAKTVRARINVLNMIFKYSVINGYTSTNPCQFITAPKNLPKSYRRAPTSEEIKTVISNVDKPFGLFALLILYTGLRKGEALALKYSDIDFNKKIIRVDKSVFWESNVPHIKQPKTESGNRTVILPDIVLPYLKSQSKSKNSLVFGNEKGELLTHSQYRIKWQNYEKETKLDITPHNLRHGFATIGFEAGLSDKDMQELMGHSTIKLTQDIYTHISNERKQISADKLNAYITSENN